MPIQRITQTDPNYPEQLKRYLKSEAPETIWRWGEVNLLTSRNISQERELWALFCSSKCPGEIILKTHDLAQRFRRLGKSTIGGFHSPVEKECLRVLLRGEQPIIICPARGLENMRLKPEWKRALSENRLLILSIFAGKFRRSTVELARQRNKFCRCACGQNPSLPTPRKGVERWNSQRRLLNGVNPYSPLTQKQTNRFCNLEHNR